MPLNLDDLPGRIEQATAAPGERRELDLPKVTLLIVTDGRSDYLVQTWASTKKNLVYPWHEIVVVDDSANDAAQLFSRDLIQPNTHIASRSKRGGAGAIRAAWEYLRTTDCDYVFHLEDDFTFNEPVDVLGMIDVLEANPNTVNVVLRRQPCGGEGLLGPLEGLDHKSPPTGPPAILHTRGFWLNPCIYRRGTTEREWPEHGHEHHFTAPLVAAGHNFAFYGTVDDPPRVHHIGEHRSIQWTW